MSKHAETHFLDVDDFEVARSIHRIVRAMHDGECPKCHALIESPNMRRYGPNNKLNKDLVCPECGFMITAVEAERAIAMFAPVMEKNLDVFENWRSERKQNEL